MILTPTACSLPAAVTGEDGGGYPSVKDQTFLLSMAQMLWDRAESSGYVYHIQQNTLPNTPAHSVLLHVAYGDHQVSMWTAEFMARTIGAKLRVPALEADRHPDTNPYVALEPVPAGDYTGSVLVIWDNGPIGGGAADGGTAASAHHQPAALRAGLRRGSPQPAAQGSHRPGAKVVLPDAGRGGQVRRYLRPQPALHH